jgi:pilus assembly protein Flp/PilA
LAHRQRQARGGSKLGNRDEGHMQQLLAMTRGLVAEDEGQDLLEYALLIVLIAVVCVGAVTLLGNQINTVLWQTIANNF